MATPDALLLQGLLNQLIKGEGGQSKALATTMFGRPTLADQRVGLQRLLNDLVQVEQSRNLGDAIDQASTRGIGQGMRKGVLQQLLAPMSPGGVVQRDIQSALGVTRRSPDIDEFTRRVLTTNITADLQAVSQEATRRRELLRRMSRVLRKGKFAPALMMGLLLAMASSQSGGEEEAA
jgi:hypothetical protein